MKKQKLLFMMLFCLTLIFTVGCSNKTADSDKQAESKFNEAEYKDVDYFITPQKLNEMLDSEDLVLLDCNNPDIYSKKHIPGAVSIGFHAFSDTSGTVGENGWGTIMKPEDLENAMKKVGIDNKKTVVFYSDVFAGPGADGRAVWQSKVAGLENVKMLVGGITYWENLGYKITDEVSTAKASDELKLKKYDMKNVADKDYVKSKMGKEVIIDTRTEKEYKGSQNAGEPRGGHIPTSVNMEWHEILNEDGTPKTKAEIKEVMASYGVKPEDTFTVY